MDLQAYKFPNGRLREAGALYILERRAAGDTYQKIARALEITTGTVFSVVKKQTWRFVGCGQVTT